MKIRAVPQFKRDLKKLLKKKYEVEKLEKVLNLITTREKETLARVYKDHALKGNWKGYRECHIENDWLLIYRIDEDNQICELVLVRTGNHDTLF